MIAQGASKHEKDNTGSNPPPTPYPVNSHPPFPPSQNIFMKIITKEPNPLTLD